MKITYRSRVNSSTRITCGTQLKRIARYNEFDNGHMLFNYNKMSDEAAEEQARQASIEDPTDVYYVQYDDVMNPDSDYRWINGKRYHYSQVPLNGKMPDTVESSTRHKGKRHIMSASGTPQEFASALSNRIDQLSTGGINSATDVEFDASDVNQTDIDIYTDQLADALMDSLPNAKYTLDESNLTINLYDESGEAVLFSYVQPLSDITPNWNDFDSDVDQLYQAVVDASADNTNVTSATDGSIESEYQRINRNGSDHDYEIAALSYMYGLSLKDAEQQYAEFTDAEIQNAIQYYNLKDLPQSERIKNYTPVTSATAVDATTWLDDQGMFGQPGDTITEEDLKAYWDSEYDNDPGLSEYDSFDDWRADTIQWFHKLS